MPFSLWIQPIKGIYGHITKSIPNWKSALHYMSKNLMLFIIIEVTRINLRPRLFNTVLLTRFKKQKQKFDQLPAIWNYYWKKQNKAKPPSILKDYVPNQLTVRQNRDSTLQHKKVDIVYSLSQFLCL